MKLRPISSRRRPPPRWRLALLAALALALLLSFGRLPGSADASLSDYPTPLYLSGAADTNVLITSDTLLGAAGPGQPVTLPTGTVAACSGPVTPPCLTGTYNYEYTIVDPAGGETPASPTSTNVSPSSQAVTVGGLPTGVTVRVYRKKAGLFTRVASLANNSSSTYIDNMADATAAAQPILPQTQNRPVVLATGYYEFVPGVPLGPLTTSTSPTVASPAFSGKGWVVDGSGGVSFPGGTWTFTTDLKGQATTGTARLDIGMWKVNNSGVVVGSVLINPAGTGENASANIATVAGTASPIVTAVAVPTFSLAANEHLYVQFWRHQTAGSSGTPITTLLNYDGATRIAHPTVPNTPTFVSPADGAYLNTATPQLTATMSDPNVTDTGTLSFQVCSDSACTSVVQSGSASGIADAASGNWNPTTLADGTYYWRAQATDSVSNQSSWTATRSFVVDTTPPTVSGVTASNGNGAYKAGQTIHVQVGFSEPVNVTGSPKLALNTTPAESATYASGSGTSTLTFDYTVQAGDNVAALDYATTGALTLNGGTIADLATNAATLTPLAAPGAAGSLAANKSIAVDTIAPAAGAVTASNANGSYNAGQTIHVQISFSEPVNVTGSPQLALNTTPAESAAYASGSGTSTLTFDYTVQAGDNVGTLGYTGTGALGLNGGTIADPAGNSATLTIASPGAAGSLSANKSLRIDTNPPGTPSLGAPADASYLGAAPALGATFSNSDAGDTGALDFQVCSDAACSSVVLSGSSASGLADGASGSWTPSLADGVYYWRAGAHDAVGNQSAWSATRQFTLDTGPPSVPVQTAPGNDVHVNQPSALNATYTDAGGGNGSVIFQVCTTSACTTVAVSTTVTGVVDNAAAGWTPGGLSDGTYYWRVRAQDSAGNQSGWSSVRSVTIDSTPPATPILVGFAGVHVRTAPALSALVNDPGDSTDKARLFVELCTDRACTQVVTTGYSATVLVGALAGWRAPELPDGSYYWRARAEDIAGNQSPWSTVDSFVVDTVAPIVPAAVGPAVGAIVNTARLSASVTGLSRGGGSGLEFQVCADAACAKVVASNYLLLPVLGAAPTWTPTGLRDGSYFWRLSAHDQAGNASAWSATMSFVLDRIPPGEPRGLEAKVRGKTLTLRWKTPTRAAHLAGYVVLVNGRRSLVVAAKTHSVRVKLRNGEARLFAVAAFDAAGNVGRPAIVVGPDLIQLALKQARGATAPKLPVQPRRP